MRASIYFVTLMLLFSTSASAEGLLQRENQQRERLNAQSMTVLGVWALANIGVGLTGWATASSETTRNFHLMNAGWNVVNLGIAVPSLVSALGPSKRDLDLWDTLKASNGIRTALIVNAALDVAYIVGGGYLALRGDRDDNPRLLGFGRAIMLQGAFLFAFDLTAWSLHTVRNSMFRSELRSAMPAPALP